MNRNRLPFITSASLLLAALGWIAAGSKNVVSAQEKIKQTNERLLLLQRIRLDSDTIVIFDAVDSVDQDVMRLFDDCKLAGLKPIVSGFLPFPKGTAGWAPGLAADIYGNTVQYFQKSPDALASSLGADPETLKAGTLGSEGLGRLLEKGKFKNHRFHEHLIESNDFFLATNYRLDRDRQGDQPYVWKISDELLWPSLDERTREIILQSGISIVSRHEQGEFKGYFENELNQLQTTLTPAERDWLDSINEVTQSSQRQVFGIQYHDRLLEIQARAQTGDGKSFDTLVRPNSGGENWRPDLGLEREQLVLAAAIQLNAFPNSAAVRAMPQIGLRYGQQQFTWLGGNMLRILAELVGDSWNDLTAARIAVYENDEIEKLGWLTIVGMADSKDPAIVLRELERLATLTSPEAATERNREREEEIARLIDDLENADANLANRAETRLALAGRAAIPALEEVARAGTDFRRRAANRILRRLNEEQTNSDQKRAVSDPGFWTTLNPGLRFEKQTGRLADFPAHTIHVTPDPTKNETEVGEAIHLMESLFGPLWQTIQVVEVGPHFIFMIGSDQPRLERIVQRVSPGVCDLNKDLGEKGNCSRDGQIQFWIHGYRFGNFVRPDMVRFRDDLPERIQSSLQPIWMGVAFNGKGLELKALATPEQIRGALGF